MTEVVVLWEDSLARGQQPNNFAPHLLALRCLLDRRPELARTERDLQRRVSAIPTRGIDKLLAKLQTLSPRRLLAVPDDDRIRQHLGLPPNASDSAVRAELAVRCPGASFVLLRRNMEDLVRAAREVLGLPVETRKPRPQERDDVLHQLIASSGGCREQALLLMPSFGEAVDTVGRLLDLPD